MADTTIIFKAVGEMFLLDPIEYDEEGNPIFESVTAEIQCAVPLDKVTYFHRLGRDEPVYNQETGKYEERKITRVGIDGSVLDLVIDINDFTTIRNKVLGSKARKADDIL